MKMKDSILNVLYAVVIAGIGFALGGWFFGDDSEESKWAMVLRDEGISNDVVKLLIDSREAPFRTDSAGQTVIALTAFLTAEDENGNPLLGIYYRSAAIVYDKFTNVDSVPAPVVDSTLDTTGVGEK